MNRYPDPDATLLRRRIAERYETEPGRVAVGNGSCEILLAAAEALCEPGAEILYAWPAFSMYPYLPALTGRPRDPRAARPRATSTTSTRWRPRSPRRPSCCSSATPTTRPATHIPAAEIAEFCERVPTTSR